MCSYPSLSGQTNTVGKKKLWNHFLLLQIHLFYICFSLRLLSFEKWERFLCLVHRPHTDDDFSERFLIFVSRLRSFFSYFLCMFCAQRINRGPTALQHQAIQCETKHAHDLIKTRTWFIAIFTDILPFCSDSPFATTISMVSCFFALATIISKISVTFTPIFVANVCIL